MGDFSKYLNQEMWTKTEQTFSGSNIKENWTALFLMTDLVSEIGTELSKKLEYKYPDKLENDILKYLAGLKPKNNHVVEHRIGKMREEVQN